MDLFTLEQKSKSFLLQMRKARLSYKNFNFNNDKKFWQLYEKSLYEKNISENIVSLTIDSFLNCKNIEQFKSIFDFFIECHLYLLKNKILLDINYNKHYEGTFDIEFFLFDKKIGHIPANIGFLEKPTLFFATYQGEKNINSEEFKKINWPKKFSLFAIKFQKIDFFLLDPKENYEIKNENSKLPFFIYNSFYNSLKKQLFCGFTYAFRFIQNDIDAGFSYNFAPIKR